MDAFPYEALGLFIAGLSFFFTGLAGVKHHLKQLTGRRFRIVMAKLTDRPIMATIWGFSFGAVTQSATAVSFILSGMISSGLMDIRKALPVIAAANLGTVVLVFLATIDMHLIVLWLIGITGVSIAFGAKGKTLAAMGSLFGIGILFFGLFMMKESFGDLPNYQVFSWLMAKTNQSEVLVFLIGMGLRCLIQSSSAIAVVAVTMATSGALSYEHSVLLILGTGPGVALSVWLLSGNLQGVGKQIVIFQACINTVSGISLAVVVAFFLYGSDSFAQWFQALPKNEIDDVLSQAYLVLQSVNFLVGLALAPFAPRLLEQYFPTTLEQNLSKPRYLSAQSSSDPETALYFVEKEQERYFDYLPQLMHFARRQLRGKNCDRCHELKDGLLSLSREISSTLQEIAAQQIPRDTLDLLLVLERRQSLLDTLTENIHKFVDQDLNRPEDPRLLETFQGLIEGLDTMLLCARDTSLHKSKLRVNVLLLMTEDRSAMMEKLRNSFYEEGELNVNPQDKATLFYVTMVFERIVWLLHMYGKAINSQLEVINNSEGSFDPPLTSPSSSLDSPA